VKNETKKSHATVPVKICDIMLAYYLTLLKVITVIRDLICKFLQCTVVKTFCGFKTILPMSLEHMTDHIFQISTILNETIMKMKMH
jgi:hypothetical protein